MSDKKNIDRLFQEKFKDFEVTPDDAVWKKIKARQNKKRKRVLVIPFWYRIAGVAALVAIILTIGYRSFGEDPIQETIVESTEEPKEIQEDITPDKEINTSDTTEKEAIVSSEEDPSGNANGNTNMDTNQGTRLVNSMEQKDRKKNAVATSANDKIKAFKGKEQIPNTTNTKDRIANNNLRTNDALDKKANKNPAFVHPDNSTEKDKPEKTTIVDHQNSTHKTDSEQTTFIDAHQNNDEKNTNSKIAENNTNAEVQEETEEEELNDGKKSIFDVINNKEEEVVAEKTKDRKKWVVAPNVAPIYYDSFGGGSSVRSEFSDNSKTGQINLSYGVQVAYNVSDKISVRSGLHKLDVGYNTRDVGFEATASQKNPEGINYYQSARDIAISDIATADANFSQSPSFDVNEAALSKGQNPGLLNHSISYYEVPLEIKYNLVDNTIGVHMIGGVSTLFLNDNELSIDAGNFTTTLGEGSNLNDISFTGNIGLGVNYNLTKQFQINLEPIFKYQFNGFKNESENFRPYSIGIYTGLSFRF
ncbi:hypothetical protein [Aquimarina sp. MMG016]|uniref:hypothetical protein n=1 Tax=Aquimarina sp. MMG016 TaxID=2822690 RepID=UPI001B3A659E|nr:hypothetical protein [Aquimarina sp. MMG016]MBQ4822090.1 hypothetical protein [Aquimarina sp. MMG016]